MYSAGQIYKDGFMQIPYFRGVNGKSTKQKPLRITKIFSDFIESEQLSGVVLTACTLISLMIANTAIGHSYHEFWETHIGFDLPGGMHFDHSIADWINDGLMAIFFLMVGLEIERELFIGELSDRKRAMLPIMAAIGGMAVPALIYYGFNAGEPTIRGIGIPTATDIAFAIAIMGAVSKRVPISIKVFLTALAIIDDLGAILVIAIFYGHGFSLLHFGIAMGIWAILLYLGRKGVTSLWIYLPAGVIMWAFMMHSGIHATITGVLLAFAIPFGGGGKDSVSYRLQHALHKPVALLIIPIFALANTAIELNREVLGQLGNPESLGIFFGLLLGKPAGIVLFSYASVALGLASFGRGVKFAHILGAGTLAGIGFTMSIFITNLAFPNPEWVQVGKISILIASLFAAVLGILFLRFMTPSQPGIEETT
jgi:Na+:H+ antiporter, NhaA family